MNKEMPPKKKPYQKPEIKTIDLSADEVLAIGCKTATTVIIAGNGGPIPGPSCLGQNCSEIGS